MRSQALRPLAKVSTPPTTEPDEQPLLQRARAGDLDAFEVIYRENAPRVFALCLRMTADRQRAQELTQDVFVRAWEGLPSFRGDAALTSWLHRIAVNVVLMDARANRRRVARVTLAEDLEGEGDTEMADGFTPPVDVEQGIDLERAIAKLPPGARRVFVLHDIEGYRHEEIARLTGTAEGTLRAQLHRARKLLMEALSR
jgi:RNA polymerase sigma-70 factor (ECF subfamily)